jgi:hypothetical protein
MDCPPVRVFVIYDFLDLEEFFCLLFVIGQRGDMLVTFLQV